MKLYYDKSIPDNIAPLILKKRGTPSRIEIFIRKDKDNHALLLAFCGDDGMMPSKAIQQGPYQSIDEAIAARNAITGQLLTRGYKLKQQLYPNWITHCQRELNAIIKQKSQSKADYTFHPEDVFLDW